MRCCPLAKYALGIDAGTTAVKACLIDDAGNLLAEASAPHDLYSPEQGWAEEDPAEWWAGVATCCRAILSGSGVDPAMVKGAGVSGMVPAIVLLDAGGGVLRRSIQQQDARATEEIEFLKARLDQEEMYARTGSYTNQQHVLPRLMWVQKHEPHVWRRTRRVMGSYDYINFRLTGAESLEANWAVESGLYDIRARRWIPGYLDIGGLRQDLFPPVRMPTEIVGLVTRQAARETGLVPGTPVVAGSADHIASALSAGISRPSDLLVKFGGGGDVLFCTVEMKTHPRLYFDLHNIPGHYIINGCMAASGSVVKWFARNFVPAAGDNATLQDLDREAALVPPGSDGLIMLPYFLGEKTPLFDPLARGVVFGLSLHHTRAHVFRAILEAVSFGFRHHVDELEELGFVPERVFGTNGGSRSTLWQQITADVLGRSITYYPHHPGSALGVAFVAAMGTGLYDDWSRVSMFLGEGVRRDPDPAAHGIYNRAYTIYRDLYRRLKDDFPRLAALYHDDKPDAQDPGARP